MVVDERNRFDEVVAMQAKVTKAQYERLNSCPVCMCELYPEQTFSSSDLSQLADQQEATIMAVFNGAQLSEEQKSNLGVVMLGNCSGEPHLFHAECLQSHYDSQADGKGHYKCMVCQKMYGVRTGAMPRGTMTW